MTRSTASGSTELMWLRTSVMPIGLEQGHHLLRVEVQLLRHFVDANLAAHRTSGTVLLHRAPSLVVVAPASAAARRRLELTGDAGVAYRADRDRLLAEQRAEIVPCPPGDRPSLGRPLARPRGSSRRRRRRPRRSRAEPRGAARRATRPPRRPATRARRAPSERPVDPPVAGRRRVCAPRSLGVQLDLALEGPREPARRLRQAGRPRRERARRGRTRSRRDRRDDLVARIDGPTRTSSRGVDVLAAARRTCASERRRRSRFGRSIITVSTCALVFVLQLLSRLSGRSLARPWRRPRGGAASMIFALARTGSAPRPA